MAKVFLTACRCRLRLAVKNTFAGYFGVTDDMDQAITIRTLVFSGDEYSFQAGAGIVADSVPAREYQEVLAKSAILRKALEIAGAGL